MHDKRILSIGIDPGSASGAIAFLLDDTAAAEDCFGTPEEIWSKLKDLGLHTYNAHAAIERVNVMPKQGIVSAGKFMGNYHAWRAFMLALGIPFELVSPKSWMKEILGSAGSTNDGSLEFCRRQFPHLSWKRKKDHNRADSLCLALWAKKRFLGA